ncbi:hypothetical protein R3P38DRAFT_604257 [Favolaschia claudopus]|uniref:F-box domain-containing protein n=1 Tax=Favolaschia claudopus TaxID=2862362 RepID=A0AAW0CAI7_9AGAR
MSSAEVSLSGGFESGNPECPDFVFENNSIEQLPPEILSEIFVQCLQVTYTDLDVRFGRSNGDYFFLTPHVHEPPLLLAEICHTWRSIALTTPRLWNSIALRCSYRLMPRNVRLCETWLKRTANVPLDLWLYRPPGFRASPAKLYQKLFRCIAPYSNRWRWLDLGDFAASFYKELSSLVPGSMNQLEYLSVSHHPAPSSAVSNPWTAFRDTPKLHHLSFDTILKLEIPVTGNVPGFPWSQLTYIDVGDMVLSDCLHILREASLATTCSFLLRVDLSKPVQLTPFTLPHLKTFKIKSPLDVQTVWSTITCPALTTLWVTLAEADVPDSQGFLPFIARCGGLIENLAVRWARLTDDDLITCLRQTPRLRHLDIFDDGMNTFSDRTCEALTLGLNSEDLVPHLESFQILGGKESTDEWLVCMLESRIALRESSDAETHPRVLRQLHLCMEREVGKITRKQIRRFQKRGVTLKLEYEPEDRWPMAACYYSDSEWDSEEDGCDDDGECDDGDDENMSRPDSQ